MEKEARRIFDPILAMSNSKGETMRTRPTLKYSVDDQDLWVYMPAGSVAKKVRGQSHLVLGTAHLQSVDD